MDDAQLHRPALSGSSVAVLDHNRRARERPPDEEPSPPPLDDEREPPQDEGTAVDRRRLELLGRVLDVAGLRRIPPPSPLVDRWLYRDSLAWLGGKPGHGKSFAAVDIACSVGTCRAWHGHDVAQGRVLYLIAEGASGLGARVDAWSLSTGTSVTGVLFLPVPVQLLDPVDGRAFIALLADLRPDLLILDTQARVSVGGEENSSRDMGRLVEVLEQLRAACGCCVLVVHHEARGGENLRGSTALEGAATTILRASKDGHAVTLTNPKQKDGPEARALALTLAPLGKAAILSHDAVGLGPALDGSALALLGVLRDSFGTQGATKTELIEAAGMTKSTYYRSRGALLREGVVVERKEGRTTYYVAADQDGQTEIPTSPSESHDAQQ